MNEKLILGEKYYQMGVLYLKQMENEEALKAFINAYNMGFQPEEVKEVIRDCFVRPNEETLRRAYEESTCSISAPPYESLSVECIPVSDNRFYFYDRETNEYLDCIDLEAYRNQEANVEFHSILLCGEWNIARCMENIGKTKGNRVYVITSEVERKLYALFQIPGFHETYMNNAICFASWEEFHQFFDLHKEIYLPKIIYGANLERCQAEIEKQHQERIRTKRNAEYQPFLSICLPTYNRGKRAWGALEAIRSLSYDAEIEIIVSDNGSTIGKEYYDKIAEIEDSRLVYHRFSENQEYTGNVAKVLELASGKFCYMLSDEDTILEDGIRRLCNYLADCKEGVIWSGQENMLVKEKKSENMMDAIVTASNMLLLSGLVYRKEPLEKEKYCALVERFSKSVLYERYPHTFAGMYCAMCNGAAYLDFQTFRMGPAEVLYDGYTVEESESEGEPKIYEYMWPEERIVMMKEMLRYIGDLIEQGGYAMDYAVEYWGMKTLKLLYLARQRAPKRFESRQPWDAACTMVYDQIKDCLEEYHCSQNTKDWMKKTYEGYLVK